MTVVYVCNELIKVIDREEVEVVIDNITEQDLRNQLSYVPNGEVTSISLDIRTGSLGFNGCEITDILLATYDALWNMGVTHIVSKRDIARQLDLVYKLPKIMSI